MNVNHDPQACAQAIIKEIGLRGTISFHRFMELSLYGPSGYYTSREATAGRDGDFVTAPELGPVLGATLAELFVRVGRELGEPGLDRIVELGAGRGSLLGALVDELERRGVPVPRLVAIEWGEAPRRRLSERLRAHAGRLEVFADAAELAEHPVNAGLIIANELFDALPVHRIRRSTAGELEEARVAARGAELREVWARPEDETLRSWLESSGIELAPGQEAELNLEAPALLERVLRPVERGLVVILDYGYPARILYDPSYPSTLRGFRDGRLVADVLDNPGRQDITAHVDFTALALAGRRAGFELLRFADQAGLLVGLGAHELPADKLAGLARLVNPEEMGGTMKALLLGKGVSAGVCDGIRDRSRLLLADERKG